MHVFEPPMAWQSNFQWGTWQNVEYNFTICERLPSKVGLRFLVWEQMKVKNCTFHVNNELSGMVKSVEIYRSMETLVPVLGHVIQMWTTAPAQACKRRHCSNLSIKQFELKYAEMGTLKFGKNIKELRTLTKHWTGWTARKCKRF